jgi:hypothetical protein
MKLVLSPEQHARHHRRPFDNNYCTLTNWLNPILDATRFWRLLERILALMRVPVQRCSIARGGLALLVAVVWLSSPALAAADFGYKPNRAESERFIQRLRERREAEQRDERQVTVECRDCHRCCACLVPTTEGRLLATFLMMMAGVAFVLASSAFEMAIATGLPSRLVIGLALVTLEAALIFTAIALL